MTPPESGVLATAWSDCPSAVGWATTVRTGGVSTAPFASMNLGAHVGDDPDRVDANRARLHSRLALPAPPVWLNQVHGVTVIRRPSQTGATADAAWTDRRGTPLVVLTADCLPVLITDRTGREVGVAHAGWRGLAAGVLPELIRNFGARPAQLVAFLGPAIGPRAFEVGPEVRAAFVQADPVAADDFRAGEDDRWWADLAGLARRQLRRAGVTAVAGGHWCTWSDRERFFSYRRDGVTGRMATLIWRQ